MKQAGKIAVLAGIVLVLVGLIMIFFGGRLRWLGHLPGDIRIKKPGFSFYLPVTTMILVSIILSTLLWVLQRLRK